MDVRLVSNHVYPASISSDGSGVSNPVSQKALDAIMSSDKAGVNIDQKVQEKVMMDLKDVQQFLYMLIGSELLIESGDKSVGLSVNKQA